MKSNFSRWLADFISPPSKHSTLATVVLIASGAIALLLMQTPLKHYVYMSMALTTPFMLFGIPSKMHPVNNIAGTLLVAMACGWWILPAIAYREAERLHERMHNEQDT
jgi:uncharacterized membrane protein YccC